MLPSKKPVRLFQKGTEKKLESLHFMLTGLSKGKLSTPEHKICSLALFPTYCFHQVLYLALKSLGPRSLRKSELGLPSKHLSRTPWSYCLFLSRTTPHTLGVGPEVDKPWGQREASLRVQGCICLHVSLCLLQ